MLRLPSRPWLLLLIALGGACGCRDEVAPPYIRLDEPAPAIPGAPPARVLLVSFWATWCPPCREELPELTALARAAPGGLEVVAVSQDPELATVEQFLGGPADPALHLRLDRDRALSAAFGVERLPVSFVITDGRLVARFEGPRAWNSGAMKKLLRRLGEQPSP